MSVPHPSDHAGLMAGIVLRVAVLAFVIVGGVRSFRKRAAYNRLLRSYRRGDYQAALAATESLRKNGQENRSYCFFRGAMANELGDSAQAETCLQKAVLFSDADKATDDRMRALAHDALGECLLDAKRYDEALREFAAALRYWPTHGGTHRNMAETWLRRGAHADEALKLARVAADEERTTSPLSADTHRINLSESLATLAWAIAAAENDRAKVDANVTEALKLAPDNSVPTYARVRFYAGNAYASLGDRQKGARLFDEAATRDAQGRWGRASRTKAAELRGS